MKSTEQESVVSGSLLKRLAPRYVREYMGSIQSRLENLEKLEKRVVAYEASIHALESTVDEMIGSPRYYPADSCGFNGQLGRKQLFREILGAFEFTHILETGSWIGNTTGYMADTSKLPVFSAELSYRYHRIASMRLAAFPGITLRNSDSRRFLSELSKDPAVRSGYAFIYLDAHWYSDLPLADEIEIIANAWPEFVIMVDDFQVPGDAGYGYDDFGSGKALVPEYIAPSLAKHRLTSWYPTLPSSEETGKQRGCVVITREGEASDRLARLPSLVRK